MKKTEKYSDLHVERIYNILQNHIKNNNPNDFKIYVDEHCVVKRTNDLKQFYDFESFIMDETKAVRFKIFHGSSRNNDEHTLWLKQEEKIITQEEIDLILEKQAKEIRQRLLKEQEEVKKEQQFQENVQTVEKQKKKISRLKKRIRKMQEEKDSVWGSFARMVDSHMQNSSNQPVEEDELTKLFHLQRQHVSPEVFQSTMEVAFRLCNTPDLIQPTIDFITQNQPNNEEPHQD